MSHDDDSNTALCADMKEWEKIEHLVMAFISRAGASETAHQR
jgi:hypothetical protein